MNCQVSSIKYQVSGIISVIILFINCNKEAPIPSYIHIDQIALITTYSIQGSNTQKIVDAWIYVDGQSIGAFEMPCTVPVLYAGSHTVIVYPGIKDNGLTDTRVTYPFYTAYTQTVTLTPGSVLKINPIVQYTSSAIFSFINNFASTGICGDTSKATSDTSMKIFSGTNVIPSSVGNSCGGVILKVNGTFYTGNTCGKYALPNTAPIYLEMDYNCNTQFSVGIVAYNGTSITSTELGRQLTLTLYPTASWNKVYINLSSTILSFNAAGYSIYFTMQCNNNPSYFYIDNVKLIAHN